MPSGWNLYHRWKVNQGPAKVSCPGWVQGSCGRSEESPCTDNVYTYMLKGRVFLLTKSARGARCWDVNPKVPAITTHLAHSIIGVSYYVWGVPA